jgi:hypothetical protein
MNLTTTLLFYAVFGVAVAVAMYVTNPATSGAERWFRTLTAVAFWPLYVPALLQGAHRGASAATRAGEETSPALATPPMRDAMDETIRQVEDELDLALRSLDGWSTAALAAEQHPFEELQAAWHAQADKIRELDRLLQQPALEEVIPMPLSGKEGDRITACQQARQANIARLRDLREQRHADLMTTLAWVRELATRIHLAKFTGAPASRAEEIVLQIATSIEGLSEVAAWREADAYGATAERVSQQA